jgi:hypothetical protein
MARFNAKVTGLQFVDGAGVTLDLRPTSGDFSCSNWALDGNAETLEARHRGTHDGLFEGDDVVQEWSITVEVPNESFTHATNSRPYDWIVNHRKGATALSNVETSGSGRWAWKILMTCNDGTNSATYLLPKVSGGIMQFSENAMEPHKFTISGKNYVLPVAT